MARRRVIDPEFWFDEVIGGLDSDTQLTYIGTWNFADDFGVIEHSCKWIKAKIFPYKDVDVERCINELIELGKLVPFESEGKKWLHIKNFLKTQKVDKPSTKRNPEPPLAEDSPSTPRGVRAQEKRSKENRTKENDTPKGVSQKKVIPSTPGSLASADLQGLKKVRNAIFQSKIKRKPLGILTLILAFILLGQPVQAKSITVRYTITMPSTSHNLRPKVELVARGDRGGRTSWGPTSTPIPTPTSLLRPEQHGEGVGTKERVLEIARKRFGEKHVASFEALVQHESGFRPDAVNASSGACGLGQALPCSKMPCELTDVDCQANWMLDYVERRYGTPNDAWYFWNHKAPSYDFNGDGVPDGNHWY